MTLLLAAAKWAFLITLGLVLVTFEQYEKK